MNIDASLTKATEIKKTEASVVSTLGSGTKRDVISVTNREREVINSAKNQVSAKNDVVISSLPNDAAINAINLFERRTTQILTEATNPNLSTAKRYSLLREMDRINLIISNIVSVEKSIQRLRERILKQQIFS